MIDDGSRGFYFHKTRGGEAHQSEEVSLLRHNLWRPRILFVEGNIRAWAGPPFSSRRMRKYFLIIRRWSYAVGGKESWIRWNYTWGAKTIKSATHNITLCRNVEGSARRGTLILRRHRHSPSHPTSHRDVGRRGSKSCCPPPLSLSLSLGD